jgi:hypothetical protein
MARHSRHSKKQFITFFTQYGIHIWAILIIANAVMVYTYHFASHAAGKNDVPVQALDISGAPSPSVSPSAGASQGPSAAVSPSVQPSGPTIYLDFTVPGIGSGGGIMKPLHPKRNVTIYLYSPNVNSMDSTVNPLYTIQTTATFDSNPLSGTYTSFINPSVDLGSQVQDGNYQIAFRTDLSFTTLIKQNPTDIGGQTLSVARSNQPLQIPQQTVLMGDSIPSGNNYSFTINDYNAFINCYGNKNTTSNFCIGKNYADFNDDGVVDGIDYNILLRSLSGLVQEGVTLPHITFAPTPTKAVIRPTQVIKKPTPPKKENVSSSSAKTTKSSKGGGAAGIILLLLFFIILGAVGVVLYLKNESVHELINNLIHLSPTGNPSEPPAPETAEETPVEETVPAEVPAAQPPQSTEEPKVATPIAPPAASTPDGSIEKDCYIKVKGPDDAKTGQWLLLTDDNGALNAHYAKTDAVDGFAKVKGVMKEENGKKFMEVSDIKAED